jgi:hypothetical protein
MSNNKKKVKGGFSIMDLHIELLLEVFSYLENFEKNAFIYTCTWFKRVIYRNLINCYTCGKLGIKRYFYTIMGTCEDCISTCRYCGKEKLKEEDCDCQIKGVTWEKSPYENLFSNFKF